MKRQNHILSVTTLAMVLSSCSEVSFAPVESLIPDGNIIVSQPDTQEIYSSFFALKSDQVIINQPVLDQNQTSLTFQVTQNDGRFVNDLRSEDLQIRENGHLVNNYSLQSNFEGTEQAVDIVFALDVTGSMAPTIESAKARILNFIDTSRAQGIHSRMCVLTFGDRTLKHCNRFYNNDSNDPSSLADVQALKTEINNLRALQGLDDPGGLDLNENSMRALIDASSAPWADDSQRFVILITDDGFLYSPSNQGDVGALAPFLSQVHAAIQDSEMRVFAVTPSLDGYNQNFRVRESGVWVTYPSIVEHSNGEHFLFSDLIAGRITLTTVLDRIVSNVKTTYHLTYIADENQGANPALPIQARNIQIQIPGSGALNIHVLNKSSNLPNGRAEYKNQWALTEKPLDHNSLQVKINGQEVSGNYRLQSGFIVFDNPPAPGSRIEVKYRHSRVQDALQSTPIVLPADVDPSRVAVYINGIKTRGQEVNFHLNLEGEWVIEISTQALENDQFKIRELSGAAVQVYHVK